MHSISNIKILLMIFKYWLAFIHKHDISLDETLQ
jgi:hypothetical protein